VNRARRDLCGGCSVMSIPTATIDRSATVTSVADLDQTQNFSLLSRPTTRLRCLRMLSHRAFDGSAIYRFPSRLLPGVPQG